MLVTWGFMLNSYRISIMEGRRGKWKFDPNSTNAFNASKYIGYQTVHCVGTRGGVRVRAMGPFNACGVCRSWILWDLLLHVCGGVDRGVADLREGAVSDGVGFGVIEPLQFQRDIVQVHVAASDPTTVEADPGEQQERDQEHRVVHHL